MINLCELIEIICLPLTGIRNFPAEIWKMTAYSNCIPEFETTDLTIQRAGEWALNTPVQTSIQSSNILFCRILRIIIVVAQS